jgi:hypothetical protein
VTHPLVIIRHIISRETEKEFSHEMTVGKHLNLSQITPALLPRDRHMSYAVGMGAGEEETCTKV